MTLSKILILQNVGGSKMCPFTTNSQSELVITITFVSVVGHEVVLTPLDSYVLKLLDRKSVV